MSLSIGQLASMTAESVKTIRYWTNAGLLAVHRGANGYRYYPAEMAARVSFIRAAQALGFTLQEIGAILAIRDRGAPPCADVEERLRAHLADVRGRIAILQALEAELDEHLKWAEAHPDPACTTEGCVYVTASAPLAAPPPRSWPGPSAAGTVIPRQSS